MKNLDEMKDKLLNGIGKAADVTKDIAGKAADKTKAAAKIAKLNIEIASEKDNLRKAYAEIGKLYYDTHKDAPEGFFVQMFEEVDYSLKTIDEKEAAIAEIKASKAEDGIEVEFEEIVAQDEENAAGESAPEETAEEHNAPEE